MKKQNSSRNRLSFKRRTRWCSWVARERFVACQLKRRRILGCDDSGPCLWRWLWSCELLWYFMCSFAARCLVDLRYRWLPVSCWTIRYYVVRLAFGLVLVVHVLWFPYRVWFSKDCDNSNDFPCEFLLVTPCHRFVSPSSVFSLMVWKSGYKGSSEKTRCWHRRVSQNVTSPNSHTRAVSMGRTFVLQHTRHAFGRYARVRSQFHTLMQR